MMAAVSFYASMITIYAESLHLSMINLKNLLVFRNMQIMFSILDKRDLFAIPIIVFY